jgi:hypothetical protein
MKKSATVLHYFGVDCGLLKFFKYSTHAILQRTIIDSPIFLEPGLAEKIAVCAQTICLPKK